MSNSHEVNNAGQPVRTGRYGVYVDWGIRYGPGARKKENQEPALRVRQWGARIAPAVANYGVPNRSSCVRAVVRKQIMAVVLQEL
eukprot:scaffold221170_cov15-Tisochrysis_lutea.AAC.1